MAEWKTNAHSPLSANVGGGQIKEIIGCENEEQNAYIVTLNGDGEVGRGIKVWI